MLPTLMKRQRINFANEIGFILYFMEEGDTDAHFVLSHLLHASDKELFLAALRRLDRLNIRGAQIHQWYIIMVRDFHTSKLPFEVMNAFMKLPATKLTQLIATLNESMPKGYPHKAKMHLTSVS